MIVNRREMALILGVSLTTVSSWVDEGMPVLSRGRKGVAWEFEPAACVDWKCKRDVRLAVGDTEGSTLAEAELRELRAKAALREIDLAERRAQVVPVEDTLAVVADLAATVRQRLRAIGSRLGPMLAGEEKPLTIQQRIETEIDDALTALSQYEPGDFDDAEEAAA